MEPEDFFTSPALIDGVHVEVEDGKLVARRGYRTVRLKGLPDQWHESVGLWLCGACDGRPIRSAQSEREAWFRPVLRALDTGGLIIEHPQAGKERSGRAVLSRIEQRLLEHVESRPHAPGAEAFTAGTLTQRQLLGNAFEYYFVTLGAYDAVAPALARLSGPLQALMANFVLEEYRHDQILLRALAPYGYTLADMATIVPLPYTSAITNQLFYLAHTDPLSLLATLFIAEGRPESGSRYIEVLERMNAPQEYIDSHREHDRINTVGKHGSISRRCYGVIPYVAEEDEVRVTGRVLMFSDLAALRVEQIVEYYGDERKPCPRHASVLTGELLGERHLQTV